ncbi:MAG: lipoate--protein ligase family protein [Deltaproteobacteria bacterium]|nr:lipoate--protein ligase family protein [Deltaproteobacteria bacterium]
MKLYNLGKISWEESQLIYHALAALGREALCLVSPATPYVCIGFHQDAEQEVDLDYCKANHIPVFRRDLGGGAVYLDGDQLFFQLVLHKDNPEVPKRKDVFYQRFLQPVINAYRRIGIQAEYRPINDVIAGTRKISGTGVGEIGDCIVFVGNMIMDFNYEIMSKVLNVPDEKFRDKVHKTLVENLSTIRRELGDEEAKGWDEAGLNGLMAEEFQRLLGPMQPCDRDKELQAKIDELRDLMLNEEWLYQRGRRRVSGRHIKIRSGTKLMHRVHKAPGGLIRADFEVKDGRFRNVCLSGDFFCFPMEAIEWLESRLEGRSVGEVGTLVEEFYSENEIETPGIKIDDWAGVLEVGD